MLPPPTTTSARGSARRRISSLVDGTLSIRCLGDPSTKISANRVSRLPKPAPSLRSPSWCAPAKTTRCAGPMRTTSGRRRARRARAARRRPDRLDRAARSGVAEPTRRAELVAGRRRRRDRAAPRRRALLVLVLAQPRRGGTRLVRSGTGDRKGSGRGGRESGVGRAVLAWRAAEYATAKVYAEEARERFAAATTAGAWPLSFTVWDTWPRIGSTTASARSRSSPTPSPSSRRSATPGASLPQRCLGRVWMAINGDTSALPPC